MFMALKTRVIKDLTPQGMTLEGIELSKQLKFRAGGARWLELFYGDNPELTGMKLRIAAYGFKLANSSIGFIEFSDKSSGAKLNWEMRPADGPKGGIELLLIRFGVGDAAFHLDKSMRHFVVIDDVTARYLLTHTHGLAKLREQRAPKLEAEITELLNKIPGILPPKPQD